ncbi:MAG: hypothetical protein EOO39_08350 [Cytophagaceae bacterium]|nr:MAG: hypothetical protein EOO39_08350 [Cytophagaceae bacterium]
MAFGVFVRLETANVATPVREVLPYGAPDKPKAELLPGTRSKLTQRCHIIAWDVFARNFATRYLGKPINQIAQLFGYTGPNELVPMLSFVEASISEQYKKMNNDLTLYYNGPARENMSAGASYKNAKESCERVYAQWKIWSVSNMHLGDKARVEALAASMREPQWRMFMHGFDNPPSNLFTQAQIQAYQIQYIQVYQDVVTGHNPDLYYTYMYGIDTFDFVQKAQQCLNTRQIPT